MSMISDEWLILSSLALYDSRVGQSLNVFGSLALVDDLEFVWLQSAARACQPVQAVASLDLTIIWGSSWYLRLCRT